MPKGQPLRSRHRQAFAQAGENRVCGENAKSFLPAEMMLRIVSKVMPQKCKACGATESKRFYEVNRRVVCSACVIKEMMIRKGSDVSAKR